MNKHDTIATEAAGALEQLSGDAVAYDPGSEVLNWSTDDVEIALRVIETLQPSTSVVAEFIALGAAADCVLVAPFFPAKLRQMLKDAGANYVDAAGNAFIKTPTAIVFIDGQKSAADPERPRVGRAFQPAGLRLLLPLLVDPGRVNETYRDLADRADVSPATVKHAFDDLERLGYLVKVGRGRGMSRRLTSTENLARKWASRYGDQLRAKLVLGRYRFLDRTGPSKWRTVPLDEDSCWGGEPAADLYVAELRPEVLTVYTTSTVADVARSLRIVPDANGPIEILEKFWSEDIEKVNGAPAAPKLVVFADLLASGEARNLEAAQTVFASWSDDTNDS